MLRLAALAAPRSHNTHFVALTASNRQWRSVLRTVATSETVAGLCVCGMGALFGTVSRLRAAQC